ncbi:HipA-like C-terminal domain-containing protein [Lachnospiraceae bacterium KH1T2]|nr:HipA-like C-terminal domain-containing protein [Lachnospiraceae bacterium KH1T2]
MAHQIGNVLGIETAQVQIGSYEGRIGSMSFLINKQNEAIVEGAAFITGSHPDYNLELMQETQSGRYYCLNHLLEISDSPDIVDKWIQMMLFDYLIGNTDRHQNNWAMLVSYLDGHKNSQRVCPLYDNGSSLCCYVNERIVLDYLGKDRNRFESLVNTKSRSMIRIDGFQKKRPTHLEVVDYLLHKYSYAIEFSDEIISRMTVEKIDELLDEYGDVLSKNKVNLIKKYLIRKIELLVSRVEKVSAHERT